MLKMKFAAPMLALTLTASPAFAEPGSYQMASSGSFQMASSTAMSTLAAMQAQSDVYYDVKGGQMKLVGQSTLAATLPEARTAQDFDYDRQADLWAMQPIDPPAGLTFTTEVPNEGAVVSDDSGSAVGEISGGLVDPSTGLVHYATFTGHGTTGWGNHMIVPVSAMMVDGSDIRTTEIEDILIATHSKSDLRADFPFQPIMEPMRVEPVAFAPARLIDAQAQTSTEVTIDPLLDGSVNISIQ